MRAKAKQGLERRHRCAAAIETESELIKVCLEMLVTDAMMSPAEPGFQVSEHTMNPRQDVVCTLEIPLSSRSMQVAHSGEGCIPRPPVGDHGCTHLHVGLYKSCKRRPRRIRHDLKANSPRGRSMHLNGADHQHLFLQFPPPAQTNFGTAHVSFVHLYLFMKQLTIRAHHRPPELLEHSPCGFVSDVQLSLELQSRHSRCVGCHQIGSAEPVGQRHAGSVHDCSRRNGRVVAAALAPPKSSRWQVEGIRVTATRASITIRPSGLGQILPAGRFVSESHLKITQRSGEIWPCHHASYYMLGCVESTG